jgi:hypothetical protein
MPPNTTTYRERAITDRRRTRRYAIRLALKYAVIRRGLPPTTGTGESVNLNQSGLLFRGEGTVHAGDSIVALLTWPARGPNDEPLFLVMTGYVLRSRKSQTAMSVSSSRLLPAGDADRLVTACFPDNHPEDGPGTLSAPARLALN